MSDDWLLTEWDRQSRITHIKTLLEEEVESAKVFGLEGGLLTLQATLFILRTAATTLFAEAREKNGSVRGFPHGK